MAYHPLQVLLLLVILHFVPQIFLLSDKERCTAKSWASGMEGYLVVSLYLVSLQMPSNHPEGFEENMVSQLTEGVTFFFFTVTLRGKLSNSYPVLWELQWKVFL